LQISGTTVARKLLLSSYVLLIVYKLLEKSNTLSTWTRHGTLKHIRKDIPLIVKEVV